MNIAKRALRRLGVVSSSVRRARIWSNREIARLCLHVRGEVINVSAWCDEDKEGKFYRDYFSNADNYYLSNYDGWRGEGIPSDFNIDLQKPAPKELEQRFDVVFNHTTLEHVFDIHQALRTMASMSRDSLIIVVPFIQNLHGPEDGDFWRPSPYAMRRLFTENGFEVCYESAGPVKGKTRYLFYWASRFPAIWKARLPVSTSDADAVLRRDI